MKIKQLIIEIKQIIIDSNLDIIMSIRSFENIKKKIKRIKSTYAFPTQNSYTFHHSRNANNTQKLNKPCWF